jgi:hypothetical protein
MLAARLDREAQEARTWDAAAAQRKLFSHLEAAVPGSLPMAQDPNRKKHALRLRAFVPLAAAACLVAILSYGTFLLGRRSEAHLPKLAAPQAELVPRDRYENLAAEKKSFDDLLAAESRKLAQFESEAGRRQQEIAQLRSDLKAANDRSDQLAVAQTSNEDQLRGLSTERNSLAAQLEDAKHAFDKVQVELTNLKAERDRTMIQLASLETQVQELSTVNRHEEQYLASDRDIRELMGARQLYIADVFDVSSDSHTRKPYGRVFYTKGKSLIFYAFDLQQQPGLKNANAFQAWGNRESDRNKPLNLGILYVDSEANRRWALRCDDATQLAELDAIFVTVEPQGGSRRPTGKAFLYASLRQEANHP